MKVLLTGISGRVGQWVARELLAHDHTVRAIDTQPVPEDLLGKVEIVYEDIGDAHAMMNLAQGLDAVIHVAAYPSHHGRTEAEVLRVNVIGTQNMLAAAEAAGIRKMILTSSVGALGFSFPVEPIVPDYFPIDEDHPRRPQDTYGFSKLANEEAAAMVTRRCGMTTIVVRPPAVLDFEANHWGRWWRWRLEHKTEHRSSDFWAYIDARDLAVFYRMALGKDITGHHVVFAMANDTLTNETAAELIERIYPERAEYIDKLKGNCLYDTSKAKELFGFEATRFWRDTVKEPEK